ncbi:RNA-directed DNA polymerase from mobile element jockey [Eumeta japonica]|uniref:RNA-directed DNA polymerase from mobile element jockey n=1 Tax=Eumeta variegata TaxID=151549 RepID=A0A4C1YUH3_EUMVA|nr:RNA-directed DNA polymerase from mobile element jockey [Eumeta japonica]
MYYAVLKTGARGRLTALSEISLRSRTPADRRSRLLCKICAKTHRCSAVLGAETLLFYLRAAGSGVGRAYCGSGACSFGGIEPRRSLRYDHKSVFRAQVHPTQQGSCLSPCLYGVYTDDIPTLAGQLQDWEEDVVLALYADDSAYFASSRRADLAAAKIQRVLDLLPEWLDKWRVAVNVTKTAAILTGQQRAMPPKLRPGDRMLNGRQRAARSMLRPVLRSHLPLRAKLALYKGYIRSRLTYAAPAWYVLCSISQRKRIQAQQSIALRMIVGAGRYVLNDVIARDLRIETVEELIRRIARRMFDFADQGPHEFLRNIAPTHEVAERPTAP